MISYLKGTIIQVNKNISNRIFAVIEVNNIGYEVQVTKRFSYKLKTAIKEENQIFTYLQIQEDKQILYGFESSVERDLFRLLVSVSGIGMQLAIALIDTLDISDLVGAIITGNIPVLTKTPGVGKKTAERISLELKTKIAQWKDIANISVEVTNNKTSIASPELLEDLEMTLSALGYEQGEIQDAIAAISQDQQVLKNPNVEEWIRSAIAWLSGE
ncbi:MAG: Holliday junction branch migration protein RuvA [Xenococcaceae cyanobacterium MO_188.B19]|nr:Holliday junction branch migration protein RuvA [Xenococcaceae cyanobacterium MO_188.B19]